MINNVLRTLYKDDIYKIKFIGDYFKTFNSITAEKDAFVLNKQQENLVKLLYTKSAICKKGRQLGATSTLVAAMLSKALFAQEQSTFVYIVCKYINIKSVISKFEEFIKQIPSRCLKDTILVHKDSICFANGTKIIVSTPAIIKDISDKVDTVVVDEASFIDDASLKELLYNLRVRIIYDEANILFIGTPNGKNYFYHMYQILGWKYSMDWWNDDRFNKDILWYKNDMLLYSANKSAYDVLYQDGWIPFNSWIMEMWKIYNINFNKIRQEINNEFI